MSAQTIAQQLYVAYFGRPADPRGQDNFASAISSALPTATTIEQLLTAYNAGNASIRALVNSFSNSQESLDLYTGTTLQFVNAIYNNVLDRDGEVEGLTFWSNAIDSGRLDRSAVALEIIAAAIRNGAADSTTVLNKTNVAQQFTDAIDTSEELLAYDGNDAAAAARAMLNQVNNTTDTAAFAATVTQTLADLVEGNQNVVGQTFTLTTGVDNIVGTSGNDTINAQAVYSADFQNSINTLSGLDEIDGGEGQDTLAVTDEVASIVIPTTATVTNVETVVFRAENDLTGDVSSFTGLTAVNALIVGGSIGLTAGDGVAVAVGTVGGDVGITNAETVTIANASDVSDVAIETGAFTTSVSVTGGNSIEIDRDDARTNPGVDSANSLTVATVSIDGAVGDAVIESDALTSLNLANLQTTGTSVSVENANINGHDLALSLDNVGYDADGALVTVSVDDNTADAVNVTLASNSAISLTADIATTISVAGAGVLALDASALAVTNTVASVTVSGAAGLDSDLSNVSSLTTVNASASTAANTLTLSNTAETVSTGSGNDTVEFVNALTADAVVALGAGDDTFVVGGASTAGASVNAGAGANDVLAISDATFADVAAEADVFTGFEILDVTGGMGTYEMDLLNLNRVVINGALAAPVVINDAAAGTTLTVNSVASTDTSLGFPLEYVLADDTGLTDSLSVTLNAVDGDNDGVAEGQVTVNSLIANGIETINIVSNASPDADDPATPNTNEALTAADYTNVVTNLDADVASVINISGAASTDLTLGTADLVNRVNATGSTGNVTVDVSLSTRAVTFLGGSGDDTVITSANGDLLVGNAGADSFTLGAGDDTVRYAADGDSALTFVDANEDGTADAISGVDVITGFTSTSDKIELSSLLGLATGDARTALNDLGTNITALTDSAIAAALEALVGNGVDFFNDGATDRAVAVARFDNVATVGTIENIFAFVDANADGNFSADSDLVIKLVGTDALLISDITFG